MADGISYGSASEFESGSVLYVVCCEISTNKFAIAYVDQGDGSKGKVVIGSVSGTTISWGTIATFYNSTITSDMLTLGLCKIDTDKFAISYAGASNDGFVVVGTVSGTTITLGSAVEYNTGDSECPSACSIDTDKFVTVYNDEDAGNVGNVCVCTVSGTTITNGAETTFEGQLWRNGCCKLDTNKFLAVYGDAADSYKAKACAFTVSGTTPTPGTIVQLDSNGASWASCAQLDTNKAVAVWRDNTDTSVRAAICTVSGTTITKGDETDINPTAGDGYWVYAAPLDTTHFIAVYEDVSHSEYGASVLCQVSGTTITVLANVDFSEAQTSYTSVCKIDTKKVVVAYCDDADASNHGEALVGIASFGASRGWWSK